MSREGFDAYDVLWHGADAVMWIEQDNNSRYLLRAEAPSWQPKAVAEGNELEFSYPTPGYPERGKVQFSSFSPSVPLPKNTTLEETNPLLFGHESGEVPGIGSISYEGSDDKSQSRLETFIIRDKRVSISVDGAWYYFLPGSNENQVWLYSGEIAASAGNYLNVYSIDLLKGKASPVLQGFSEIDFSPKSQYWAAIEGGRPLSPYGPNRRVWTNELFAGDLRTGKSWKVARGLVHVVSVSERAGI